jgi:hypothetical protein
MPVNSRHPQVDKAQDQWKRSRDATAPDASDRIKEEGATYLPMLSGQANTAKGQQDYARYKQRAYFHAAAARTVQAYCGLVFRKDPMVTLPKGQQAEAIVKDLCAKNIPLPDLAATVFAEVAKVGRVGLYATMAPNTPANGRAYLTTYKAESIINWQAQMGANGLVLSRVVLQEMVEDDSGDLYAPKRDVEQYRDIYLDEARLLAVDLYRKDTHGKWGKYGETTTPTVRGERIDFVPFTFANATHTLPTVEVPPLLPLVDANLDHYNLMADYRHGLHFTALPTAWVAGFDAGTELVIGSGTAWVSERTDARAGFLEFTGQGLNAIKDAIEMQTSNMATLGARLLEADKRAAEAAETHKIRQSREESTVSGMAQSTSQALTQAMRHVLQLSAIDGYEEAEVQLNTDLVDAELTPQEVQSLVGAWQAGAMSFETLYYNLRRGEKARPGVDAEEEKDIIALELAAQGAGAVGSVGDGDGDGQFNE